MQLMKLLHRAFEKELAFMHQLRLKNLMDAATSLIKVNKLTLIALGRNFPKKISTNLFELFRSAGKRSSGLMECRAMIAGLLRLRLAKTVILS